MSISYQTWIKTKWTILEFRNFIKEAVNITKSLNNLISQCQVYYHLGAYDEALHYALGAATLLDLNISSEYVDTVVGMFLLLCFEIVSA